MNETEAFLRSYGLDQQADHLHEALTYVGWRPPIWMRLMPRPLRRRYKDKHDPLIRWMRDLPSYHERFRGQR